MVEYKKTEMRIKVVENNQIMKDFCVPSSIRNKVLQSIRERLKTETVFTSIDLNQLECARQRAINDWLDTQEAFASAINKKKNQNK